MRTALVLALALACASASLADINISFTGNISHSDHDSFSHRFAAAVRIPLGSFFYSREVDAAVYNGSIGANADSVWSMSLATPLYPPISWTAYFNTDIDLSWVTDWASFNVSGAAGFMASAYVGIVERMPNGTLVRNVPLKTAVLSGLKWTLSKVIKNGDLQWVTMSGQLNKEQWSISLTFAVSSVVGTINYGDAIVAPKMVECIVQIANWTYANKGNQLGLQVAVATGKATWNSHGVVSNKGTDNSVFFTLDSTAQVDGQTTDVSVGEFVDADFLSTFGNPAIALQLAAVFGADFEVKLTEVVFPADANDIVYDPAAGNGEDPYTSTSSNKTLIIALVAVGVAVVVAAIIVTAIVVYKKKQNKFSPIP